MYLKNSHVIEDTPCLIFQSFPPEIRRTFEKTMAT